MSYQTSYIAVVGGTGAQGIPVIRGLVEDKKYKVRALTRDTNSARAKALVALGNVELTEGTFASEEDLRKTFRGCDGAFVNIDGFNCGEKTETYWSIRAYELALEEGLKFYVFGNLDYVYKKSGYDPKFRTGHYDGKGRIAEWILSQNKDNQKRMGASIFTTGPYIEMSIGAVTPFSPTVEDGVVTWRNSVGDGAVVHVALDDCAHYVRWIFDNTEQSNGLDLEVAIDHINYADLAAAFEKVTGHPARYVPISLEKYWEIGSLSPMGARGSGYNSDPNDPAFMTIKENFSGFFTMWANSGGNKGVVRRDYKLLDEIHPNRIKTPEEFFRREEAKGQALGLGSLWDRVQPKNIRPVLKLAEDGRQGKL
ncbi:NmrA family protein [Paraphoma chrysanthemicola]|uniref:NmrA family protein n=1 Tax=Paraphoma chrysanthemicola TaxID=798071 RepID=A0A8K0QVN8_9PLEO|nr:NmrA family protein [Paraphoma chrysanthemicola]